MILRFPNRQVLQLALTSESIPSEIQCAPAQISKAGDGSILIATKVTVPRDMLAECKKLGVQQKRRVEAEFQPVLSWQQAIPVEGSRILGAGGDATRPEGRSDAAGDEGPVGDDVEVLLEIDDRRNLPLIVAEMLRLGNDRQSFREVREEGASKTLLRVVGPPYYTLLRAIDNQPGSADDISMTAYVQRGDRVWVQLGYRHPLGERLRAPSGKWLLISADNRWRLLDEAPFRDIYETLEFRLPQAPQHFQERPPSEPIQVPLGLVSGAPRESAELWVLTRDALSQVEQLIRQSDDQLLSRLAFAVADAGQSEPTVILRARPSRQSPPVLVLDALACRPYLKIPHLFLPVGRYLNPPLRRDVVIKLLADRNDWITWLTPIGDGQFKAHSIDDASFRPLSDWVDYVVDHEAEPLQAWIASHRFDFERFVCQQEHESTTRKAKLPESSKIAPSPVKRDVTQQQNVETTLDRPKGASQPSPSPKRDAQSKQPKLQTPFLFDEAGTPERDQLQLELSRLENEYQQSEQPQDSPVRALLWEQLGRVNAALMHRHDSTICWTSALWQPGWQLGETPTSKLATTVQGWLQCEQRCAEVDELTPRRLDHLMADQPRPSTQPSLVASYLVWAASQRQIPEAIVARQSDLMRFLQRHENDLPVRAAWLAWCALYRISGNDVLLLARARDRLLQRLFRDGLAPEFDMPAFLRPGISGDSERFKVLRDRMWRLRASAQRWIVEPPHANDPKTRHYTDLVFAYALARLGETARCRELLGAVEDELCQGDAIHKWVLDAYRCRIRQALGGQSSHGPLPSELLSALEELNQRDRYVVDRLRQLSRIVEPHLRVDPFQNFHRRYEDDLSRELALLQKLADRKELSRRIKRLLDSHPEPIEQLRVLPELLQLSPRVGEELAAELLDRVAVVIDQSHDPVDKARLLQRAIQIAAHYGRVEPVQVFIGVLQQALPEIVSVYLALPAKDRPRSEAIELLLTQSFRGLRKFGMKDQIGRLYGRIAELVGGDGNARRGDLDPGSDEARRAQRLLIGVAGGWFYFDQQAAAREIADRVLRVLQAGEQLDTDVTKLGCAYLDAVSQAGIDEAAVRVEHLFSVDDRGTAVIPNAAVSMMTDSHFSIAHLEIVESAVIALTGDDFSLSSATRRWLDEDEFLVRSRIHDDMHQAISKQS